MTDSREQMREALAPIYESIPVHCRGLDNFEQATARIREVLQQVYELGGRAATARAYENEQLSRWANTLCQVAQLLDGWHQDGTAWSEWDEQVRQQVSVMMREVEAIRELAATEEAKPHE